MRASLIPLACALVLGCAPAGIEVARLHGVYSTHFDGIPDQGRICAVLTNRRGRSVEWVLMTLGSRSAEGGRWRTDWLYQGRLEPGASVAVELQRPPIGDRIGLRVRRSGIGEVRATGRPAWPVERCSERSLVAAIEREDPTREAPGRGHVAMRTPGVRSASQPLE